MSADAQEGERLGVGGLPIHGGLTPVTQHVFTRALLSKDEVDDLQVGNFYRLVFREIDRHPDVPALYRVGLSFDKVPLSEYEAEDDAFETAKEALERARALRPQP
jgi:hypothetical protein